MLMDGVQLMIIGMSVVFVFLVLLVAMMSVMTVVVRMTQPAPQPVDTKSRIAAVLAVVASKRNSRQ